MRFGTAKARRTHQKPIRLLGELQLREVDRLDIVYGEQSNQRPLTDWREQKRGPDNDDDQSDDRQVSKQRLHDWAMLTELSRLGSSIGYS